jgi:hypothetical protein
MSRFSSEIKIIPKAAWAVAIISYACLAVPMLAVFGFQEDMGPLGRYLVSFGIPLLFLIYILLAGYIYADARRRGMRAVVWTLLAFLIPNAIGFILYFIMREPLMHTCPGCGKPARAQFAFCTYCGTSLAPACPKCRQAVETEWPHCPHCGGSLKAAPVA